MFCKRLFRSLFLILVYFVSQKINATQKLSVGLIYCEDNDLRKAIDMVSSLNSYNHVKNPQTKVHIDIKGLMLESSDTALSKSLSVCDNLISKHNIYAVIIADPSCIVKDFPMKNTSSEYMSVLSAISFTCSYYNIPVIDMTSRSAEFSDKVLHNSFVRMSPPFFHQANVWIELLKKFEFNSVNLIHSFDAEGKMLASRFQDLADSNDIRIVTEIEYLSDASSYENIGNKLISSNSRVFILQGGISDMKKILKVAKAHELTKSDNVWIVSQDMLSMPSFALENVGFLICEYTEDIDLLFYSILLVKKTFEALGQSAIRVRPAENCDDKGFNWKTGKSFLQKAHLSSFEHDGISIELDEDSNRVSTRYKIINVNKNRLLNVGNFQSNSKNKQLNLLTSRIIWPGNSSRKPLGTKWSSKLKIVLLEEKPFIFKIPKAHNKKCSQLVNNSIDCPWSHNGSKIDYCCYGYCIDLIKKLSEKLSFQYEVYLVPDGLYGDIDNKNNWNGLMGEILGEKADLILAPITITPDRMNYVEFTKPFKYQGITILVKRNKRESNLASFLQPFKEALWLMVLISVHVVAVVLYLLDRFSPFARFKMSTTESTEEDALNLSRALWFTWGVLLNSGIGDSTPRSFSARVLGMVWAGFAMIMVASYTANLAAFLVLDRPEAGISGINDARLRNPQDHYKYATVKNSAVERYFKRQVELSTMFRTMEHNNYNTAEDAIEALKNEEIKAFIWDSVRLEYEAIRSCDFITTGELFGRSSYGLALKKGNPWLDKISLEILGLHESGIMEELDKKWILLNDTYCKTKDSPSTLGLANMAGVFMLVAGGIVIGVILVFIEISYKNSKDKKRRETNVSRNAFATWRKNIEKRKMRTFRDSVPNIYAQDEIPINQNLIQTILNNKNPLIQSQVLTKRGNDIELAKTVNFDLNTPLINHLQPPKRAELKYNRNF